MKIKYVGCFESVIVGGQTVKNGEIVDLPEEVAQGVAKNPGQWEIVRDAVKASGKGVK
jgi:hypothetical protein